MREILFRGKRIDNQEWVYGLPVDYCNEKYILVLTNFEEERVYEQYPHKEMWSYEVVPETVSQYTGLTDKNGKKIWENDIVTCRKNVFKKYEEVMTHWEINEMGGGKAVYYGKKTVPRYKKIDTCGVVRFSPTRGWYVEDSYTCVDSIISEVLGNVFENPELLEDI